MKTWQRFRFIRKIPAVILAACCLLTGCTDAVGMMQQAGKASEADDNIKDAGDKAEQGGDLLSLESVKELPGGDWQVEAVFPDRRGKIDDTLALNSIAGFDGFAGRGKMYVSVSENAEVFDLYVNDRKADTSGIVPGEIYELDFSSAAKNGRNTVMVTSIEPLDAAGAVKIDIPFPTVTKGEPKDAGIRQETLDTISDIISSDIEYGFTSAQLAVIRNGMLVYENSWGKISSYTPDGERITDSADVTGETLYDLASVTKMFSVNYSLQKLLTDGKIDLDSKITDYLGMEFVNDTLDFNYDPEKVGGAEIPPDLKTQKEWKASLTIRDILRHQGGFPPGPRYANPYVNAVTQEFGEGNENILFAGNDGTKETKEATIRAVCKTPLLYRPGTKTVYSDVDYLILGVVIEKVTGKDLDTYLKETFFEPMELSHITYNPLENGFAAEDCAATEPAGNTRDGWLSYPGIRTDIIQGEVHDEMAYYSMGGVSGHAGLFSNATDLAKLAFVMFTGGYGNHRFFSRNCMDMFTAPKNENAANWGLGWWREGDDQRPWYFGSQASSGVFGHQGWTGTLVMIDPDEDLVIVYLTNKINSPVTDKDENPNKFDGGYYTASSLGFVPQILTIGMDGTEPVDDRIFSLLAEMTKDSMKLAEGVGMDPDHPLTKNAKSKLSVLKKSAQKSGDEDRIRLAEKIADQWKILDE